MANTHLNKRDEMLFHSRNLLSKRGFNAFSHRELANLVGVKSSSVHYYFPTKEDIGLALISTYQSEMIALLQALQPLLPEQRLDGFIQIFAKTAADGEDWCLAGMLASDFMTLGEALKVKVKQFFDVIEQWLAQQIREVHPDWSADTVRIFAQTAIAMLEGALLLARSQNDAQRVKHAGDTLKTLLNLS